MENPYVTCVRCNKQRHWIETLEIDFQPVCVDCLTPEEKTENDRLMNDILNN